MAHRIWTIPLSILDQSNVDSPISCIIPGDRGRLQTEGTECPIQEQSLETLIGCWRNPCLKPEPKICSAIHLKGLVGFSTFSSLRSGVTRGTLVNHKLADLQSLDLYKLAQLYLHLMDRQSRSCTAGLTCSNKIRPYFMTTSSRRHQIFEPFEHCLVDD